jgi:SAM-dependent methyltransferase
MHALEGFRSNDPFLRGILSQQEDLYDGQFYHANRWRWVFRDDCRYRKNRLLEVLTQLGFSCDEARIFELGFGSGDLLFQFPTSCTLMGVELSKAAVQAISADPRLDRYHGKWFQPLAEDGSVPAPPRRADLVLASHVLEHVPDDKRTVSQLVSVARKGGLVAIFVPIETEGYDPKHVRTYTVDSLKSLMAGEGLKIVHAEDNYHIRSGPMKLLDHPARHDWPILKSLEGLRDLALTLFPYAATRGVEELLQHAGITGTQAMVIGKRV